MAACATSSRVREDWALSTISVPAAPAARALASSPSGWAAAWFPAGSSMIGKRISCPRTVVRRSRWLMSTIMRGRSMMASNTARVRRRVISSVAAPAMKSYSPGPASPGYFLVLVDVDWVCVHAPPSCRGYRVGSARGRCAPALLRCCMCPRHRHRLTGVCPSPAALQRNWRKKARTSCANNSGSSQAAKWPPLGISSQRRIWYDRSPHSRADGRFPGEIGPCPPGPGPCRLCPSPTGCAGSPNTSGWRS